MGTKNKKIIAAFFCVAASFLANPVLGATGWTLSNTYNLPGGTISSIVEGFLFWLLAIFAFFGIIGFIISGIIYLLSTGDDTAVQRAKKAMMYSIVGIVIGLAGFVIIQAVDSLLTGSETF
ncbi:MAG TPA: hypothetical protein PLB52_01765 [Candidatus Moranbacteria bacterium]|nr:hypothetical protein [Candidatus Moranbacteria bacterium]